MSALTQWVLWTGEVSVSKKVHLLDCCYTYALLASCRFIHFVNREGYTILVIHSWVGLCYQVSMYHSLNTATGNITFFINWKQMLNSTEILRNKHSTARKSARNVYYLLLSSWCCTLHCVTRSELPRAITTQLSGRNNVIVRVFFLSLKYLYDIFMYIILHSENITQENVSPSGFPATLKTNRSFHLWVEVYICFEYFQVLLYYSRYENVYIYYPVIVMIKFFIYIRVYSFTILCSSRLLVCCLLLYN